MMNWGFMPPMVPACRKIVAVIFCVYYLVVTSPIKCTMFWAGFVLADTVINLSCRPVLPVLLKVTLIFPPSPGCTGVLGHSGVVQPQVAVALVMINGDFPVLVNLNS